MLTNKQREELIRINFEYVRPYIRKVMEELPALENSVHIEGIAESWYDYETATGRKGTIDIAIREYEKTEFVDDADAEEIEKCRPKYKVNEDLTQAIMENVSAKINFAKKVEEYGGDKIAAFFSEDDGEPDRFYGTVANKDTLKKLDKANSLMDVLATDANLNVEKFVKPSPRGNRGIVAINLKEWMGNFDGVRFKAFRELIELADEFTVIPRENSRVRLVFSFYNMWSESREMTDEELEEEDRELTEEEIEEIEKELAEDN